jgi:L-lactate dehydrogenase complex protein LldG
MPNMDQRDNKAKQAILGRVRQGLREAVRLPQARATATPPASELPREREALIQSFANELAALKGNFYRCSRADLFGLVRDLIAESSPTPGTGILAWEQADLPPAAEGLLAALAADGVPRLDSGVPFAGPERAARLGEMEQAVAGLTGVEAALADVGGLAVRSGAGRGRLAALLPVTHIALVTPEQFYASLYDWMETLRAAGRLESTFTDPSNLDIITGPSRTADIEKTLVLGMHGPRNLLVICIDDA